MFSFALSEGCEVGQWSEWGTCSRNNKTCGFKWGLETRTRQIVKKPAKDTIPCPTIAESRRCKMAMRHCPGGKHSPRHKNLYELSLTEILFLTWKKSCFFPAEGETLPLLCQPGLKRSSTTMSVQTGAAALQGKAQRGSNWSLSRLWNCVFPVFLNLSSGSTPSAHVMGI